MRLTAEERKARLASYAGSQSEREYAAYVEKCKQNGWQPSYCDVLEWAEDL